MHMFVHQRCGPHKYHMACMYVEFVAMKELVHLGACRVCGSLPDDTGKRQLAAAVARLTRTQGGPCLLKSQIAH